MDAKNFSRRMKAIYDAEIKNDTYKGYNHDLFRTTIRYDTATLGPPPRTSFLLTISPPLCNKSNSLHGGCASTLIDVLSTGLLLALSRPGFFSHGGGVTRSLNVKFLRPVALGTEVRIVSELVHAGKRLALVRTEIRRVADGVVCVVGEHDKVNVDLDGEGEGDRGRGRGNGAKL
ncbi:hypothetical protein FQN52_009640 [Onygenales sp. PD_12]|nr:hypothetical protein FQN52_009640 [Onygenales sp. PD_12]